MLRLPELFEEIGTQSKESAIIALNTYFKEVKLHDYCNVMDVGCGPGNVTNNYIFPALPQTTNKLVGIDNSNEMIKHAETKYRRNDKLSFYVMDITTPNIPIMFLSEFDHIVSFYCFHLVFDHKKALSNILKMLKPGGNMFLNFLGDSTIYDVYTSLKEDEEWKTHLKPYNLVESLLQAPKNPAIVFEKVVKEEVKLHDYCNVMDIGCGPGNVTNNYIYPALPQTTKKLVAIDSSNEMIKHAERKYRDNDKLFFYVMDITTSNIPLMFLSEFDHIVSFYCFHLIFDHRKALSNIFKMLKPGGNMFLNFLGYSTIYDVYTSLKEEEEWKTHLKRYNSVASPLQAHKNPAIVFEKFVKEIGFKLNFCISEKKINMFLKDIFKKIILGINIFELPQAMEEPFINYHLDFFKKRNLFCVDSDNNEYYYSPYTLLTVYASKPL
ncbi:hypothetical protein FQR65_LT12499 [Abscondita terminalis]|nr:hypothetical protein FQR65_LT12499 [Abscondita terminalis]